MVAAFKTAAVSVGTSATRLTTFDPAQGEKGFDAVVYNNGASTVYIGGSPVTTGTGIPLAAGAYISLAVEADLYGIVTTGTVEVRVGSMGVA